MRIKKKYLFPAIFLSLLLLNGCLLSPKLIEDNTSKDFLKTKYAQIDIYTGEYSEGGFTQHMYESRKHILESNDLSDQDKKELTEKLDSHKYEKGRYFFYNIYAREPLLNEKKPDNLQFIDKNNNDLIEDILPSSFKITTLTDHGSYTTYQYIYMIKLKKPITSTEMKENGPYYLIAYFSDGKQNLKYIIK